MNIKRRLRIIKFAAWIIRVRLRILMIALWPVGIASNLNFALARWKTHRRVEALKKNADSLTVRNGLFRAECQAFLKAPTGNLEIRRQSLLATQSALHAENGRIQAAVVELQSPQPIAAAAPLMYILVSAQARLLRMQRKNEALSRVVSQIKTNPNFYWDLLFWFMLPGDSVEDQIGDLKEEFTLRSSGDGEAVANAWYRREVVSSVMDRLWGKIERWVAIGSLIEWLFRK